MKKEFRPSWDDYFMALARIVATRATCDRLHTGAVLVKDQRIISTGYNGAPPGLSHCDDNGHLLENGHCVRSIHAEHNAILQAAVIGGISTKGSTLYMLYSPCIHCAKYIVTSGIRRVVAVKIYRQKDVSEYFKRAKINFELYKPSAGWDEYITSLFKKPIREYNASAIVLRGEK